MTKEYKLHSFADLLKLSDAQIDKLCSELPGAIKEVKAFISLVGHLAGQSEKAIEALSPLIWVDDGRRDIEMDLCNSGGESRINVKLSRE